MFIVKICHLFPLWYLKHYQCFNAYKATWRRWGKAFSKICKTTTAQHSVKRWSSPDLIRCFWMLALAHLAHESPSALSWFCFLVRNFLFYFEASSSCALFLLAAHLCSRCSIPLLCSLCSQTQPSILASQPAASVQHTTRWEHEQEKNESRRKLHFTPQKWVELYIGSAQ